MKTYDVHEVKRITQALKEYHKVEEELSEAMLSDAYDDVERYERESYAAFQFFCQDQAAAEAFAAYVIHNHKVENAKQILESVAESVDLSGVKGIEKVFP